MKGVYVGIGESPLSLEKASAFVDTPENGALNLFVGRVRNHNLGKAVNAVSYDVFTPLACAVFTELCAEARARFGEDLRLYVEHFK
ncbi:MAG: molybdenum cofactor biosynthesis protein MoaE, partial [Alphaproteobacteria bacterium]|nr:molybdenum cofactor biosynthesis protein MoaE [Alphaproteobacteria bacterium]